MPGEELFAHVRTMAQHVGAKSVYGEPVVHGDTTVVPVARVAFGFGGGTGKGAKAGHSEGAGGGLGFVGGPAGYIEMTPAGTRFVAIGERKKIAGALLAGLALGYLAGKLRRRAA
ncbi:MAG: hypothetical protein LAP87_10415 [Acidobacteriia bacterium]|nr:hypothetical protein [Terriglobia bacterium]